MYLYADMYRDLEKKFSIIRWLLTLVVIPLTIVLSGYNKNINYLILLTIVVVVYHVLLTIAAFNKKNWLQPLLKYTIFFDIPFVSILIFLNGGLRSATFLIYFLIILYDGAKYGYLGSLLSLGQSLVFYSIAFLFFSSDYYNVNHFIIRVIYLISLTIVMYEVSYQLSESHSKEQAAKELAYKDHLTKLPNRLLMSENFDRLRTEYEKNGQSFAIVIMDIDNFKDINDSNGHAFGDQVLMQLAQIFNENLTSEDFICRFGGEEFVAFLAHSDQKTICERVNKLHDKIDNYDFTGVHITVSIGINIFKKNFTMIENISFADEAMYVVKNTGKNKVLSYEALSFNMNRGLK